MHSSRMRTIRCSGHLGGMFSRVICLPGGAVCLGGVSAQVGCLLKGRGAVIISETLGILFINYLLQP